MDFSDTIAITRFCDRENIDLQLVIHKLAIIDQGWFGPQSGTFTVRGRFYRQSLLNDE